MLNRTRNSFAPSMTAASRKSFGTWSKNFINMKSGMNIAAKRIMKPEEKPDVDKALSPEFQNRERVRAHQRNEN